MSLIAQMVGHTWTLFLKAAPWLLLGLAIAGLLNVVAQLHASRDLVPAWLTLTCGLLLIVLAVPPLRARLCCDD